MRLGIFSEHLRDYAAAKGISRGEAGRLFAQYGVCETEVGYGEWGSEDPVSDTASYGMPVRCLHACCSLCAADEGAFSTGLEAAARAVAAAGELGAEFLLLVAGLPDEVAGESDRARAFDRCCAGLEEAVRLGNARGVRVTVENFSQPLLPFSRAEDLARMFRRVPGLGYTLDAGNFACFGERLEEAQPRLPVPVLVHFKDWLPADRGFGDPPLDGVPYGTGIVPLRDCFGRLRDAGYDGTVILEHNAVCFRPDDLTACAGYMQKLLAPDGSVPGSRV